MSEQDKDKEPDAVTSAEMSALFDYLREATEQLEVVNRVVAAVNSSRSIDEVFSLASQQMRGLIPFDRASIALCEEDGEHLRVFAISGDHAGSLAVGAMGVMRGSVTELALKERRMIVIPELSAEKRFNVYEDLHREGFHSSICCPLFSADRAIGSLNLTSRSTDAYGRKHQLALERLAPPLAIAIEKVLLLEQAENRSREMEAAAKREELAGRIGRQLSSSLNPSLILQETVDLLGRSLESDRCHLTLFEDKDDYSLVGYEFLARADVPSLRGHRIPLRSSHHARRVLDAHEPVATNDIRELAQDELMQLYVKLNVCAVLAAPVSIHGMQRGLLELHINCEPREWTPDDEKLLGAVAAQVSVALTNARLYEASRRRSEELEGLYKISRVFSTLTDTSEIYGQLTSAIAELVGGGMCMLTTYDRRRNIVRAEAPGYHTPSELIDEYRFNLLPEGTSEYSYRTGEGEYLYQTGEAFFSNQPASDERFNQEIVERYGVRSVLIVPMLIKRELIGFIYVANRPGGFRERDARLLEIFAAQAAETITNARLFATVQAQAEREAVVNRLTLALQQASDPLKGVEIVVERVGEVLGLDRCAAVLFSENERADFYGEWCAEGVAPISKYLDVLERTPLVGNWLKEHRQPLVAVDVYKHSLAAGVEDLIKKIDLRSLVAVPILHQGRFIGWLSGHQTRTTRRWAEDDIDLLTAIATQIGSTLENARLISELREANRLKDEFLATLSHELRTPLTAIKGWVELLADNEAVKFDEELADGIEVIKSSSASLTQLISDLLDLSRIQRKVLRLELKPADVNQVIMDAVQVLRQSAEARRQDLKIELDSHLPTANVDAHRVQQVVWNLLTNAIKFTPEGGSLVVRSRLFDAHGILIGDDDDPMRWIVIEVEDDGEGIPPDFLPHVWDRFRQADSSSTRRHGGLGIGLALVKELVEAHGGLVEARSNGRGATFTVRLPLSDIAASAGELTESVNS
jgi:GAF domain-containing protein